MVGVNYGCPKSARPETGKSKRQTNDECRDMRKEMGVRCRSVCAIYVGTVGAIHLGRLSHSPASTLSCDPLKTPSGPNTPHMSSTMCRSQTTS